MSYQGIIIEESLTDKGVVDQLPIVSTTVEPVTEEHQTPWINQWTLHTVEVPDDQAMKLASLLSESLAPHHWYADFKNDTTHLIIFPGKIFVVDHGNPEQYREAIAYGQRLGIPDHQLDFSPTVKPWKRAEE